MPPYDDRLFVPPAPVLSARLRNPQSGTVIPDVLLLIDTGADVTLLPLGVHSAGIRAELLMLVAPSAVSFSPHASN